MDHQIDAYGITTPPANGKFFYNAGHKNGKFYFYQPILDKILSFPATRLRAPWIFQLAPVEYWQSQHLTNDNRCPDKVRWSLVSNDLMQESFNYGEYQGLGQFMAKMGVKL